MGFFFALLAAFNESLAKTIDKLNFTKNHITYRQSLIITFIGMTLCLGLFIGLSHQHLPHISFISVGLMGLIGLIILNVVGK